MTRRREVVNDLGFKRSVGISSFQGTQAETVRSGTRIAAELRLLVFLIDPAKASVEPATEHAPAAGTGALEVTG